MKPEAVTAAIAEHGEGPMWDRNRGVLRWVDMLKGDILTLQKSGQVDRQHVSRVVAAIRPRRHGGLVVAVENGFTLMNEDGAVGPIHRAFTDPQIRMNDGGCDPLGNFFCGSMAYDFTPRRGALYRFEPDARVVQVLSDLTISNGIAWNAEGTQVYYVDSGTGRIDVFDYELETGTFHNRRPFVTIPSDAGLPDGIALDAEGGVWVALWGGSAVHRYTNGGAHDVAIEFPVSQVTACSFGGPDLTELFVSTSNLEVDSESQPLAGALFRVELGVRGIGVNAFAA